jgi:hypothetical protein
MPAKKNPVQKLLTSRETIRCISAYVRSSLEPHEWQEWVDTFEPEIRSRRLRGSLMAGAKQLIESWPTECPSSAHCVVAVAAHLVAEQGRRQYVAPFSTN